MNTLEQRIIGISQPFNETHLLKGIYIAVIHATRIPPHIGLIIGGKYHSLTVKGQDINTSIEALVKNSFQRKIPSLFIKIKAHPTFSEGYLKEHFITNIQQFPKVDIGVATCLSPIKLFFNEVFDVRVENINFLFELIPVLYAEGLIEHASALFINEKNYQLPEYSEAEINKGIMEVKNLALSLKK
ncbi:MAG: hypothetical protein WAQ28_00330 [Bacteroidia bacterium]|jgi:hypothetical protein